MIHSTCLVQSAAFWGCRGDGLGAQKYYYSRGPINVSSIGFCLMAAIKVILGSADHLDTVQWSKCDFQLALSLLSPCWLHLHPPFPHPETRAAPPSLWLLPPCMVAARASLYQLGLVWLPSLVCDRPAIHHTPIDANIFRSATFYYKHSWSLRTP